ncbi:ABC transporter permease subunit [uncultured Robinsoniella sp.]|uniref:ABC transporter permease subunit n=1 Tax=uncultured Robinsoniella sp. TaxID=904190 RepID=UPI00374EB253
MNLFIRECKSNIKAFSFWCIGIIFLILASAGKTTSMVGHNDAGVTELLAQLPKSVQTVFGVGVVDYSTAIGVFAVVLTYIALIAAFHAASLGVSVFGKEERDKTFEFLYVKGRTRNAILLEKVISGICQLFLLNAISFLVTVTSVKVIFDDNIISDFLPMMTGLFFIQLVFFGLGLLMSLLCSRMKTAGNITMGIVLVTFLMSFASDFSENIEWMGYLTPFKYFDGKEVLTQGLSWVYVLVCTAVALLCIAASFVLHGRRDLHC